MAEQRYQIHIYNINTAHTKTKNTLSRDTNQPINANLFNLLASGLQDKCAGPSVYRFLAACDFRRKLRRFRITEAHFCNSIFARKIFNIFVFNQRWAPPKVLIFCTTGNYRRNSAPATRRRILYQPLIYVFKIYYSLLITSAW